MNGNIKQSLARLSFPQHSGEVRQREVEALGLLHGGAVSCAVPVPPASYATWAGGAGQKGPEMLWLWPVQVASACCRNVTAPPMGIHKQTGPGCLCRACWCKSRGRTIVGSSLLSCMCTRLPQKPMAVWFHPGAWALPLAALGVGALRRWCPLRGGLCPGGVLSPQVTLHPPWGTRQAARAQVPCCAVAVLSCHCHQQPGRGHPCL